MCACVGSARSSGQDGLLGGACVGLVQRFGRGSDSVAAANRMSQVQGRGELAGVSAGPDGADRVRGHVIPLRCWSGDIRIGKEREGLYEREDEIYRGGEREI